MADTPEVRDEAGEPSDARYQRQAADYQQESSNDVTVNTTVQPPMTRRQKLIVLAFCMSNFGIGVFYSLLGPFFPIVAAQKGLNSLVTGFVFGVYELMFVIFGPIFGIFLTRIGARFMFLTGIMTCGYCAVLFGFLEYSPPGITFAVLCFAVRCTEGVGAAAMMTSSFAIIAQAFPNRVATMLGTLELFSGLGMMLGSPIGGWLYEMGGFRLPFFSSGAILIVLSIIIIFLLPSSNDRDDQPENKNSILKLLSSPIVLITCWLMACGSGSLGFLSIGLSPALSEQLNLSPLLIGVMFLIAPGVYALSAPIWGMIADKIPGHSIWLLIVGYIFGGGMSFLLLGPAPFLDLGELKLWTVIVSQLLLGFGIGTLVIGFQLMTISAQDKGMPDNLDTFGQVSGIFTSSLSFGAFLGPVAGGALLDSLGFQWTSTVVAVITGGSAIVTAVYMVCARLCRRTHRDEPIYDDDRAVLVSPSQ